MSPDDPRHGLYAGALAHRRDKTPPCFPCLTAERRYQKVAKMRMLNGVRNRVPLGQRAYDILTNVGCTPVAAATGLWRNNLYRAVRNGPDGHVLRSTRDAILRSTGPTPTGVQRRIQALAAIGHTLEVIADTGGVHAERLGRIARAPEPPTTALRRRFVDGVVTAYDTLHAHEADVDRYTNRCRSTAAARGWLPPEVWDDIDDPNEDPTATIDPDYVDDVVVERLIAGARIPASRLEKTEALRRWMAAGGSQQSLCTIHGWQHSRYVVRQDGAA